MNEAFNAGHKIEEKTSFVDSIKNAVTKGLLKASVAAAFLLIINKSAEAQTPNNEDKKDNMETSVEGVKNLQSKTDSVIKEAHDLFLLMLEDEKAKPSYDVVRTFKAKNFTYMYQSEEVSLDLKKSPSIVTWDSDTSDEASESYSLANIPKGDFEGKLVMRKSGDTIEIYKLLMQETQGGTELPSLVKMVKIGDKRIEKESYDVYFPSKDQLTEYEKVLLEMQHKIKEEAGK